MPYANANGVKLYYEEAGAGVPLLFAHEFASDLRQWEAQLRWFSRSYRCIAFNARGYPPSDVPSEDTAYEYQHFADDIGTVLDAAGVQSAYVVGWSMGAYACLQFALRHRDRAKGVALVGCGSGSPPALRQDFMKMMAATARAFREEPMEQRALALGEGESRVQLKRKDPRGWAAFVRDLAEHSPEGMALTAANYQGKRPSLEDFTAELAALRTPVLIMTGDEDASCIETSLFLKRTLPGAGLWMAPQAGHAPNLEDPAGFNRALQDFIEAAERGRWVIKGDGRPG
ncbi:MAG: alpha/beta fold hydrolase [Hyphomonadaceae bacterium]